MRLWLVVVLSIALGLGLGAATGYWNYGAPMQVQAETASTPIGTRVAETSQGGKQPMAAIDEETFKFKDLENGTTQTHDFVFTNQGEAPLTLELGETTCKCTLSKLKQDSLPPGQSGTVTLEWKSEGQTGPFRQSAVVRTNDPRRRKVTLVVEGTFTASAEVFPSELVFSSLPTSEPSTAEVKLLAYHRDDFRITSLKMGETKVSGYFEVSYQPLAMPVADHEQAKSGYQIQLTIKPGLPLGPFKQTILVTTDLERLPKIEIPVQGTVIGDISVLGPNWDSRHNVLRLGSVQSRQGASRELKIFVRGPHHKTIRLEVQSKDPSFLEVALGEPMQINKGTVTQVPLSVEVPKGTRTVNRLGSQQGPSGRIVLKTNHPDSKELVLRVHFAVEE